MTRTLVAALVTLGDPGTLSGGYLFHRRLAELAPEQDARLVFISFPSWPFPLASAYGPWVIQAARRRAAQVLVLDSIAAAFFAPWPSAGIPVVGMLHQPPGGIDHGPVRSIVQAGMDRLAYRRVERLLVASDSLADDLRRRLSRPERIHVVPPGRDVASQMADAPEDVRRGRRAAFLSVGNWVERKGLLALLEAFSALPPEAATLHLVGDTRVDARYAHRVQARLRQVDLADRVVVHGAVSTAQVAALYAACDAFVLPSLKDLADHERDGLLVRIGDIPRLTDALRRLADDPLLRRRLGDSARRRAEARPTWRDVARLFFDHLRAVLDETQR